MAATMHRLPDIAHLLATTEPVASSAAMVEATLHLQHRNLTSPCWTMTMLNCRSNCTEPGSITPALFCAKCRLLFSITLL